MTHSASTTADRFSAIPQRTSTAYRPDIDGLRAVAVLAVLLNHLSPSLLPGGYVGVDVFFVISGYLITKILRREIGEGSFSFMGFYGRRAKRILPALLAVCLATLAVGYAVMLPSDYAATLRVTAAAVLSFSNILFWRDGASYFGALEGKHNPLLHTWSLSLEEQFYLVYPALLLVWSLRLHGRRRQMVWLGAAALGSLLLASLLARRHAGEVFYLLPFRAWELLAGAVLALGWLPPPRADNMRAVLRLLGLSAIGYACLRYGDATVFPGLSALVPVLGAVGVIHAGIGQHPAPTWLAAGPVVYLGRMSYSLYLWHWPVIVFAGYLGWSASSWSQGLSMAALSFLLASLSFHYIEQPVRQARPQWTPWLAGIAVATVSAVVLVTAWGTRAHGFRDRFDAAVLALDDAQAEQNPFMHCFNRPLASACRLGDASASPDTLVWGDSHALSWAVAFDSVLASAQRSGLLVSTGACPPFLDLQNRINPRCRDINVQVNGLLAAHPGLRTVVLSGFWSTYFRLGGPVTYAAQDGQLHTDQSGAGQALAATVASLQAKGLQVVLLGPVPVYARSVPRALAMEKITGRPFLDRSRKFQDEKHGPYHQQIAALTHFKIRVLEPLNWLCSAEECRLEHRGAALYRDGHHLNSEGALLLKHEIAEAIRPSLMPPSALQGL